MKPVYIVAGVSGSGKTTIGKLLAKKIDIPFFDGDDFHPQANIDKMAHGHPLNDEDRKGWLKALSKLVDEQADKKGCVIACSALKEKYRKMLNHGNVEWIFLDGSYETIFNRLSSRKGHYFKADMLKSQFADLEEATYGIHLDIRQTPGEMVDKALNIIKGS
ncbi:MAG: gluconate kinase [Cytophagaceae bacterium]|nr:gluconate kinase [Cytophagaceae bacterium]|tara:strand:- start:2099 stop:2584 length:486 start_codon:yes stop_codon:yes gene_type:complete